MRDGDASKPRTKELWMDPQFRRAAQTLDSWTLIISLLNNLLHLFMRWRKAGSSETTTQMACLSLFIACYTVLQVALHRTRPDTYYKHRYHILLVARVLRMCTMAEWALQTRQWFASPTTAGAAIDSYFSTSHAFRPLAAALALLVFSGTLHSLTHALTIPLPFSTQAAFHALYLALMLAHAPSAAHSLELTPYRQALQEACLAINGAVVQTVGQDPCLLRHLQALPHTCQHHSALMLVVFVQLYLGTVLPLMHARRVDRNLLGAAATAVGQGAAGEHGGPLEETPGQQQERVGVRGMWGAGRGPVLVVGVAASSWLLAALLCSAALATTGKGAALQCE